MYISVDKDEKALNSYLKESHLERYMPVYYDRKRVTWNRYNLKGTPTTFILDKNGIIFDKWTGARDWDNFKAEDLESFITY